MQENFQKTGIILKGRYCILERIGGGGEGSLYLARDLELGVLRAVKELPLSEKREAKLLRLLEHPNLPGMVDYAETEQNCCLVMEYIRGKSLGQLLREGKSFSPEEILKTGRTLLGILSYLHGLSPPVYYGDLKPDNIMLTKEGSLYLVDFGSAVFDYGTGSRTCKGTAGFAAPEQYKGRIVPQSDIYSLGRTLENLCGKKKWKYWIRYPGFAWFLIKCCFQNPEKRWQSAEEARDALIKIRPLRKKVRTAMTGTAAFLAALAFFVTLLLPASYEPPPLEQVLTPVLAAYYSPAYRFGSFGVRDSMEQNMENTLLRLVNTYKETQERIRILELLVWNGELQGKAHKAELFYRELLTLEPKYGRGYLMYGRFLFRQDRAEESRAVYKEWKKKTEKGLMNNDGILPGNLKKWKEEMEKTGEIS